MVMESASSPCFEKTLPGVSLRTDVIELSAHVSFTIIFAGQVTDVCTVPTRLEDSNLSANASNPAE